MRITYLIKQVLREQPETRDSDKALILAVWERQGFYLTDSQKAKFWDMPPVETIRRVRQKIQEKGVYTATERVRQSRRIKSQVIQQNAPQAKPERLERLFDVGDYTIKKQRFIP